MTDQVSDLLTRIEADVTDLVRLPVPEEDTPDAAGRGRALENKLAGWRRGMVVELPSTTKGEKYKVVVGRKCDRSYSIAPVVTALGDKYPDDNNFELLMRLITSQAVKLTWSWTYIKRMFEREDMELRIVSHEILDDGDPDGPHVGEVWTNTQAIETTGEGGK